MELNENKCNDNEYHNRSLAAQKSTMISVAVNILLSCVQILLGIFYGSQGLIADGIHSFSDLVSDFVVLIANKKVASLLTKITITVMDAMKMGRR